MTMKIAYLMNTYPVTSGTFIRREIEALERTGLTIERLAVRQWNENLVDPLDQAEQSRTKYLLSGNVGGLLLGFARELLTNPVRLLRGARACLGLAHNARGQWIRHVAYLLQAVSLRHKAEQAGIDHVHVHFWTNATAVAMLSRLMGGPSYSFTAHGPDEFDEALLLSPVAKIANAAFAVAISHFGKSQLMRFGGAPHLDRIHVVRCGLALGDFEPSYEFATDNQTLVCVGRLCPQKAQVMIPGAVAKLRREFPGLKVVLIGDGESRAAVEAQIVAHGVGDLIELQGWRANAQVRETLRNSRALLLASAAEGLPVVIMEALALGRPVISTYIAGIPELVDAGCGWIIPAGSEEHLVTAMRQALAASPQELENKEPGGPPPGQVQPRPRYHRPRPARPFRGSRPTEQDDGSPATPRACSQRHRRSSANMRSGRLYVSLQRRPRRPIASPPTCVRERCRGRKRDEHGLAQRGGIDLLLQQPARMCLEARSRAPP